MPNLILSLFVTTLLSFTAPVILVGAVLVIFLLVSYVPGLVLLGQSGAVQLLNFLAIFGNGHPFQGVLTLGLAAGIVGGLFDLFNFYLYQSFRD